MRGPKTIRIDLASTIPAYRQIADGIRASLVSGEIAPGQRLPTVRQIAIELAVHHNTVAEAYRLLADEGWLALKRRSGAVVLQRPSPNASAKERGLLRQRLRGLIAEMRTAGLPFETIQDEFRSVAAGLEIDPRKEK
jgi:DNA-binding transcriptional regulator YhcF (GntR family)